MSGTPLLALKPGTRIETFEIRSVLGAGGFGITYKAWDHQLQCDVAIKEYLPSDLATRDSNQVTVRVLDHTEDLTEGFHSGLEKFLEEARILARFKDPNLVGVKQFISVNGTAYMVMDYEKGRSLAELLRDDPPPVSPDCLQRLATRLLRALAKVHDHHILHRDIKPANIYLREDGDPVLIDFGSARERTFGKRGQELTSMVTFGYAPHEQYHRRGNQGPWTDLYALAATLYFCATGIRPAEGMERFLAVQDGNPDPLLPCARLASGTYDARLLAAIDWMLHVAVERRPPDARAVLDVIEGGATVPETATAPDAGPREHPDVTVMLERTEVVHDRDVSPRPAARRPGFIRGAAIGVAVVILLAVVLSVRQGAKQIEAATAHALAASAASAFGTPVETGAVRYDLFANTITVERLDVTSPAGYGSAGMISARVELSPASRWWWWSAGEPVFAHAAVRDVKVHVQFAEHHARTNVTDFARSLPGDDAPQDAPPRVILRALHMDPVELIVPGAGADIETLVVPSLPPALPDPPRPMSAAWLLARLGQAVTAEAVRIVSERQLLAGAAQRPAPAGPHANPEAPVKVEPAGPGPERSQGSAALEDKARSVIDWFRRKLDQPPNREVLPGD